MQPATRWAVEQVLALAPKPSSLVAARPAAVPSRWSSLGADQHGLWGRYRGTAEPYDTVVDHVSVGFRCTCPSRVVPCKHTLALLLLWVEGHVPEEVAPPFAATWLANRVTPAPSPHPDPLRSAAPQRAAAPEVLPPTEPSSRRDDRVQRMRAGLTELDRWLDDRIRTGLADPSLARYDTWDQLAARLVDAQVGGLANRVRRLAGVVGTRSEWHQQLLGELGVLHLLAQAGQRIGELPGDLADSVAGALGWQVRQADVLAGVPSTDVWQVLGRSDTREDRIEVRRLWLWGTATQRWAMVLSFAAYGQSLDDSLQVGRQVHADVFRYPGVLGLRVIVGTRHGETHHGETHHSETHHSQTHHSQTLATPVPDAGSVAQVCRSIGKAVAAEPWIDRYPVTVTAAPAVCEGRWVLTDGEAALPLHPDIAGRASLLACTGGAVAPITCEWTPLGLIPLTVHLADRWVDVGPVADSSFVGGRR